MLEADICYTLDSILRTNIALVLGILRANNTII